VSETPANAIDASPVRRSGAVAFIFVTILLDMFALGMIMPILPKLVESFVANDTASAARIFGLFGTAWALMQFLFSPIIGSVRPAAGGAAVKFRAGAGLRADGAGAVADLAVRRPGNLGHHLGERLDGVRLHH
jgi:DHA1 family tetracycline resistance protein-like MFS transporter